MRRKKRCTDFFNLIVVAEYRQYCIRSCSRSLMDRTQDSDSCNAGSIPTGCILFTRVAGKPACRILPYCFVMIMERLVRDEFNKELKR